MCSKEFWGRKSLLQHLKNRKEEEEKKKKKKLTGVTTNLFQESILIITLIQNIQEIHFCVLDVSELLRRRGA